MGATTELKIVEEKQVIDGETLDVPPILFGFLGQDKNKKTICVYGHLDVQPAVVTDGWDTDPFVLTEIEGKLFGRGSTDDKGPVLDWINCIEAYKENGMELPVNVKFVFECMEESGSEGLDDTIQKNLQFFDDVDFTCISDNYWLTTSHPCITYGLRGITYFFVTIECSKKDLHSGIYGGAVHEAMWDLVAVFNSLVSQEGKIQIPGIYDSVAKMTPEEEKTYESIHFDLDNFREGEVGTKRLVHSDKAKLLQHRWRYPSLSIHGIEGAFAESGAKTVIPRKVIGKFSMRLVPDMNPEEVEKITRKYIEEVFAKRNSPNTISVSMLHGAPAWVSDFQHIQYEAGRRAIRRVWGVEPDMIREGGSIPVALSFEKFTKKNVMLLPIGQSNDGAHSNNEKISRENYINGVSFITIFYNAYCY